MAAREASIHVTIRNSGFLSGLRGMEAQAATTGHRMGRALSGPMAAGFSNVKKGMKSMVAGVGGHMKTIGTLGGAFAMGKFLSDAMDAQHIYRNIAEQVNRVAGNSETWQSIQKTIEPVAAKTGQRFQDLSKAFQTVFSATGNLEFSKRTMEALGTASTATGEDIGQLANVVQLAARKFGVTGKEAEEVMARLVEKIGVGGMSLDDMNNRFAVMAGEAATAGLKGKEGFSTLLGIMLKLDSTIGESASRGLRTMFQTLKDGSTQMEALKKKAHMKFEPDMTAFDKIRQLLTTAQGQIAAKYVFTGDARSAYDELAKPFIAAFEKAKAAGGSTKKATELGLKAYDEAMAGMTASNAKFSKLQDQAAERLKDDPTVIMRAALNEMGQEFTKPAMLEAMKRLAGVLPDVADGFTKVMNFVMNHPLLTAGGMVGGRILLSFAGGFLSDAGARIGSKAATSFVDMTAESVAKHGMWGSAGRMLGVAAGAAAAFYIGKELIDGAVKARGILEGKTVAAGARAETATGAKSLERKKAALVEAKAALAARKREGIDLGETLFGMIGGPDAGKRYQTELESLTEPIAKLTAEIKFMERAQKDAARASQKAGGNLSVFNTQLEFAALALQKAAKKVDDKGAGGGGGPGKGPHVPPQQQGHSQTG